MKIEYIYYLSFSFSFSLWGILMVCNFYLNSLYGKFCMVLSYQGKSEYYYTNFGSVFLNFKM